MPELLLSLNLLTSWTLHISYNISHWQLRILAPLKNCHWEGGAYPTPTYPSPATTPLLKSGVRELCNSMNVIMVFVQVDFQITLHQIETLLPDITLIFNLMQVSISSITIPPPGHDLKEAKTLPSRTIIL